MAKIENLNGIAILSFPDMKNFLLEEIEKRLCLTQKPTKIFGDLLYFEDFPLDTNDKNNLPFFAKDVMIQPKILHFDSITDAANELKNIQRNWASYQYQLFRRAALIQEKLPYINTKEKQFPFSLPHSPVGLWTLLDKNTLIFSKTTTSPFPAGEVRFIEDHENPPSRAYLKIQESLVLADFYYGIGFPKPCDKCFEAGASPGGWTWVLTKLGADVTAVDRAELSDDLMKNPLVHFVRHDAFTLKPEEIGECDWVLSDVICYPERLYEWVTEWLEAGLAKNIICTIKMQGKADWNIINKFAKIQNSRIVHLNYNKHELTWIWSK